MSKNKKQQQALQRARKVKTMGGTRVNVGAKGQVKGGQMATRVSSGKLRLSSQDAKKVNKKVASVGGSLAPGKGMAVSRYVTVKAPGRRGQPDGGRGRIASSKHQLAIYAPVAQATKSPKGSGKSGSAKTGSSSGSGSSSSSRAPVSVGGATGNYATVERLEQEAPEAPNFYDTANSFPVNPNYSPTGSGIGGSGGSSSPIYWDRTAENLFSYSDRLGSHNRQTGQWLSSIGAADRRESDAYLQNFARALPKAPDSNQANQSVLSFLEQANKRLGFG